MVHKPPLIAKAQAEEYRQAKGHVPLVIGLEYTFMGEPVKLVSAESGQIRVGIESRFGDRSRCDAEELEWRPSRGEVSDVGNEDS
jgi:hypothetical protein